MAVDDITATKTQATEDVYNSLGISALYVPTDPLITSMTVRVRFIEIKEAVPDDVGAYVVSSVLAIRIPKVDLPSYTPVRGDTIIITGHGNYSVDNIDPESKGDSNSYPLFISPLVTSTSTTTSSSTTTSTSTSSVSSISTTSTASTVSTVSTTCSTTSTMSTVSTSCSSTSTVSTVSTSTLSTSTASTTSTTSTISTTSTMSTVSTTTSTVSTISTTSSTASTVSTTSVSISTTSSSTTTTSTTHSTTSCSTTVSTTSSTDTTTASSTCSTVSTLSTTCSTLSTLSSTSTTASTTSTLSTTSTYWCEYNDIFDSVDKWYVEYKQDSSETMSSVGGAVIKLDLVDSTDSQIRALYQYCVASGDFDVRIDLVAYTPEAAAGLFVGFIVSDDTPAIGDNLAYVRYYYSGAHRVVLYRKINGVGTFETEANPSTIPTKLRVTRVGTVITGYYYQASAWHSLGAVNFGAYASALDLVKLIASDNTLRGGFATFDNLEFTKGCPAGYPKAWTTTTSTTTTTTMSTTTTTTAPP